MGMGQRLLAPADRVFEIKSMKKDFDKWNANKKTLHNKNTFHFYHERDIWWCALGVNVGFEQDGTGKQFDRPVVIIRGFNKNTFFGVALTGKKKEGKYYCYLNTVQGRDATAVLSQVRLIDTKRLVRKIKTLDEQLFLELKKRLQNALLGENNLPPLARGRGRSHM